MRLNGWIGINEAHEKLGRYHKEAEHYRSLPKGNWRGRAAEGLRRLAARLEGPRVKPLSKGAPRVG